MTIRDNGDYIAVLLCSPYTTISGSGVLQTYTRNPKPLNPIVLGLGLVLGSEGKGSGFGV